MRHIPDPKMFMITVYLTPPVAAVEMSEPNYSVGEGDMSVEVCVDLTSLPAGGLECEITVTLDILPGTKTGKHIK